MNPKITKKVHEKQLKSCDICGDSARTGRLSYDENICPKSNCDQKELHYHDVCIKCCDKMKIKKKQNSER
jgi:hypothetical protein